MKTTEMNLIPIFVAIYEERNLSKAAKRLDISQPAVSKALSRLRDVYEEPLFHRSKSGVEPTSFAIDIYPSMQAALKNFTLTLSASRKFDPKASNYVFSIACVTVACYELMPRLLKLIRQQAPNISLEVHPLFTEDYESDLRLQRYDLILGMAPKSDSSLMSEAIIEDRLMVVCCNDHPRIVDSITMEEFLAEEHVVVSNWHSRRSLLSHENVPELADRKIVYRAPGAMEMLPAIQHSEYIGMLPESTIATFAEHYQLKAVPVPFAQSTVHTYAIWHPSSNAKNAHKWLRDKLRQAAQM